MKYKRLIGILCAAAVAAASVPALPAYAAESGTAESGEQPVTAEPNGTKDESGTTEDGFAWKHFAAPGAEQSEMQAGESGTFTAKWKNTSYSLYSSGKTFAEAQQWDAVPYLTCDCQMQLDWSGNGIAGIGVTLQDGKTAVDGCIIDAWSCKDALREQLKDASLIGFCTLNGIDYDLYSAYISQISITGTPTIIRRYLSVRKNNALSDSAGDTLKTTEDVTAHLQKWAEYGKEMGSLTGICAFVEVTAYQTACVNSGSAAVLENTIRTDEESVLSVKDERGETADGYFWEHGISDTTKLSEMRIGKNGTFTAAWEQTATSEFSAGKCFPETPEWNKIEELTCDYETTVSSSGNYWAGVRVLLKNGLTVIDGYILDAWNSEVYADKVTECTIDGIEYEIYTKFVPQESIAGTATQIRQYLSVRKNSLLPEEGGTFSSQVNLKAHLQAWAECGKEMGKLMSVTAFADAFDLTGHPPVNSGTAAVTKNQITYQCSPPQTELAASQTKVSGDANGDGEFNIADIVSLTRWLMHPEDAAISNWVNADFNLDNRLDVRDLTLMKRAYFEMMHRPVAVRIKEINTNKRTEIIWNVKQEDGAYLLTYEAPSESSGETGMLRFRITEAEYRKIMSADYDAIMQTASALSGWDQTQNDTTLTYSDGTERRTDANMTSVLLQLDQLLMQYVQAEQDT